MKRGDDALVCSDVARGSFREPAMQNVVNHPDVYATVVRRRTGQDHLGPARFSDCQVTLWMSTSIEICEELVLVSSKPLSSGSGVDNGAHVGVQTSGRVVAAVCKGYIKTLRKKDPGRVRKMLRQVAARIRNPKIFDGTRRT